MSSVTPEATAHNPHAARLAAFLGLVADLISLGAIPTAQGALDAAWRAHEAWPLGLDEPRRQSALSALAKAEQALAFLRRQGAAAVPVAPAAAVVVRREAA